MIDETAVPRAQPVMPHTGGDICAHIGVELCFLHRAIGQVVVPPTAVGQLNVDEPLVGALRRAVQTRNIECHRGLDVIPRIAVTVGEPRDHAGVELQGGDRFGRLHDFVAGENAFDVGHAAHRFTPYTT